MSEKNCRDFRLGSFVLIDVYFTISWYFDIMDRLVCSLCETKGRDGKDLSRHLKSSHNLSFEAYVLKTKYGGVRPACLECGSETRFIHKDFSYRRYCVSHSHLAEKEGGKRGGRAPCPFKGETKETRNHLQKLSENLSGEKNPQFGIPHSEETKNKISLTKRLRGSTLEERILNRSDEFELVTPIEEYVARQGSYLVFRCKLCGEEQNKTLETFERGSKCNACFPKGRSSEENDMFHFIQSLASDAISNDRKTIYPKEIDVFVPSKNYGFEYCGLYYHSDAAPEPKSKDYHLSKLMKAVEKGINLVQIFGDEWKFKRTICESMIRHRLGGSKKRIHARLCAVETVEWKEASKFFDETHIAGATPSIGYFALKYKEEIVAMLSLRTPVHKDVYPATVEIARFSTALDTHVIGGLDKLLKKSKAWALENEYKTMLTYVDRRHGTGKGYEKIGFSLIGDTGISYDYTDCNIRYNRFKFRSRDGKKESDIAREAKVDKIYGCGSWIYILDLEKR